MHGPKKPCTQLVYFEIKGLVKIKTGVSLVSDVLSSSAKLNNEKDLGVV